MKINAECRTKHFVRARTKLVSVETGKTVKVGAWANNLVLDNALLGLAGNGVGGYAGIFTGCRVGSGTNPNSVNSAGSPVFTQAANVVTCTGTAIFTSSMVGSILKYGATGSGGVEQYIQSVNVGAQTAVVSGSMTQSAIAGTIWFVQQTALQTLLYSSNTYQTSTGSNGGTLSGNQLTLFRTFVFPVEGTSYSVNEVGYNNGITGSTVFGRIVLGSTTNVPTSNFLVVEIQLTVSQSPSAPVSVSNTATNFNNAGMMMANWWNSTTVLASGASGHFNSGGNNTDLFDNSQPVFDFRTVNDLTLNSTISPTLPSFSGGGGVALGGAYSTTSQPVGTGISTCSWSYATSGQTCYSITFGCGGLGSGIYYPCLVILLTTPQTLPTGTFQGTMVYVRQFSRTLSN